MSNRIIKLCSTYCIAVDEDADTSENILRTLSGEEIELRVKIVIVENAGTPFGNNIQTKTNFCYKCFDSVDDQKGVYVFQEKDTKEVLYVGRGGFGGEDSKRSLKDRVQQHYRRGDTGANFRINWAEKNCNECKGGDCSRGNNCSFCCYLKLIIRSRVIFFCICNNDNPDSLKKACDLENWIGCCLHSKYSHHP